jgi:hypothetical protein
MRRSEKHHAPDRRAPWLELAEGAAGD